MEPRRVKSVIERVTKIVAFAAHEKNPFDVLSLNVGLPIIGWQKERERGTGRDLFAENGDNNERMRSEDKKKEKKIYIYIYIYVQKETFAKDTYTAHVAVSSEPTRNKQNESFPRLCAHYNPISLSRGKYSLSVENKNGSKS